MSKQSQAESPDSKLQAIFDAQKAHQPAMAATTSAERIQRLRRLEEAILARRDDLYDAMFADFRKSPAEVELTELQSVVSEISHTAKHLARWMRPRRVGTPLQLFGTRSEVRYEAKGVVLILSPWNYPFNLTIAPLVAAIGAGNCAVIKPSEKTPNTSRFMGELVSEVFDPKEVALVEGEVDTAKSLLDLPFDHIFFTGSTQVGRFVMAAAARHLASVTLELGGKSPAIVDTDCDVGIAAERIVWGKFVNAGQTCVAPDYVLVQRSKRAAFVDGARAAIAKLYGSTEEDRKAEASFCRLVDRGAFDRITGLLDDAVARGSTIAIGGESDPDERYLAPTVLTEVPPDAKVMEEEIFGPILPVLEYDSVDSAIEFVRARPKPLALYIFSESPNVVQKILSRTSSGGVAVNNVLVHLANPNLPFGGTGESGLGSYHGEYGFRTFSHERSVLRQGRVHLLSSFYPPYSDAVLRRLQWLTRWLS